MSDNFYCAAPWRGLHINPRGDVILNGVSLRQQLIANGFAREYYGEAKTSWCN